MSACVRCGIQTEAKPGRPGRCDDCRELGYRENTYWIQREVESAYASRCECGRSTWADCGDCRRVGAYLNNQRIARRRAAA